MRLYFVNIKREIDEDINHFMRGETEPTEAEILADVKENKFWEPKGSEEYRITVTDQGEWTGPQE